MKKTLQQLFVLAAFVAAPMTMNAQVGEGKVFPGNLTDHFIPKAFTYDGKNYLCGRERNSLEMTTTLTIYNDELEIVKSFTLPSANVENIYFADLDDNQNPDYPFYASQTLFNADEKYEAVLPLKDESGSEIGFSIVSEDGTELQSVKVEVPGMKTKYVEDIMVFKINGKYYLAAYVSDYNTYNTIFYSINRQTNEIKAVKNIPGTFAGRFSLDGRRQEKMQRGVNIVRQSDGTAKKVLVK